MRRSAIVAGWLLGAFLVARAIVEPFAIDVGDPATYRDDWGGPTLVGVLAVHILPGIVAAVFMIVFISRSRRVR
jgi:hypothetical protein